MLGRISKNGLKIRRQVRIGEEVSSRLGDYFEGFLNLRGDLEAELSFSDRRVVQCKRMRCVKETQETENWDIFWLT